MAKRGRKGKRRGRRSRSRKGSVKTPRTVSGVWRAQPLLVKGGMALTALEIATNAPPIGGASPAGYLFDTSATMQSKLEQVPKKLGSNAMNFDNYKPLAYGVIAHYVAKKLKIKGL